MNTQDLCCEVDHIHEDVVDRLGHRMPEDRKLEDVAELFKMFGDKTRARILCALSMEELCVCDLAALLGMNQSAISHQLRLLKAVRLVRCRKQGREVYYSLDDQHIQAIFAMAFTHVSEEEV
ncbi:MAG: helix-turn-helix transcriptional regulator [Oscillospiraceae bacterium]|nr:helix-turn-helix transcriptional regulator [Oscillospiraceae bacterium]MBR2929479.1 helix-turn-helix transcriptional regulator [Oscillospiraceae bacterium]MBR6677285.1 helix-turn-helix transcriptional regulator [Oscillospiraceae bacterium]